MLFRVFLAFVIFMSGFLLLNSCLGDIPAFNFQQKVFPEPKLPFAPKKYICYRAANPVNIDGKLSDLSWNNAPWTDYFVDIEGHLKPVPRFKTRAKMLWDDKYFYIGAELEEPDIWATLKKRDSIIFYDNDFEVFIDPDGDTHRYYELELNAFSTEWDLFLDRPYRDEGKAVFFWDIGGLKTKTLIDGTINKPGDKDKKWTVEIAMPWDVLKECAPEGKPPAAGEYWRVNFSRVEWKTEIKDGKYEKVKNPETGKNLPEDNWVWSPQGLINMHYPEMWGYVLFSEKESGPDGADFQLKPEEEAKWLLRRIYYRERTYYLSNGSFTDDISKLNLPEIIVKNYNWPPEIKCTWNLFEAKLHSSDKTEEWMISQDGKVWKNQK